MAFADPRVVCFGFLMSPRVNIYLSAIFLVAFSVAANCQETGKATLVDEFGNLSCEDVIARQDYLFAEIQKTADSVGYAIIFADEENRKRARGMESVFQGQTEFRRFDDARFKVIRAAAEQGLRVQLWVIPRGASVPEFQPTDWDFEIDPTRKPFKINASEYDEGPCPIGSQFKRFSDYLGANPKARGHIVIWARTAAQLREEKDRVKREFLTKYNIEASCVRFFYIRHRSPHIKWEHWIVPRWAHRG
jgi:hypothetical protein